MGLLSPTQSPVFGNQYSGGLAKSGYLFLDGWLLGAQDIQKCFKGWAVRSTRPGGTKTHGIGLHRQWSAYRVLLLQAARATGH